MGSVNFDTMNFFIIVDLSHDAQFIDSVEITSSMQCFVRC